MTTKKPKAGVENLPRPTPETLFWDDLPYQYQLMCFNSAKGELQIRCIVRSENKDVAIESGKELMNIINKFIQSKKTT